MYDVNRCCLSEKIQIGKKSAKKHYMLLWCIFLFFVDFGQAFFFNDT